MLVYPVQAAVDAPYALAGWAVDKLAIHTALVKENTRLKQELLIDAVQLQQTATLEQENARLRELMQAGARLSGHVVVATLLAVDMDPFRHVIVIDKGTNAGVFEGQTLLDAHGIIGQVIQAGPFSSTVALITDPSQAIQVELNRTSLRTLAIGGTDLESLSLPYIANNADINPGDLLVSSGLGGRYPPGYPVAVVTQVRRDPAEPFANVSAHAVADLNHGRIVLLYFPALAPVPVPEPEIHSTKKTPGKRPP